MNIMIDNQTILCIGILLPAMTILVFSQWLRYHQTEKIAGEMIAQIPMTTKQKIFRFLFQVVVSFLFICFFPQIRRMRRYNFLWDFAYIITAIVVSVMFALVYSLKQKICTRGILNAQGLYLWSNVRSVKISDKQSDVILVFLHESVSKENCIKLKCDPDEIKHYIQIIEKQIQKEDMLI